MTRRAELRSRGQNDVIHHAVLSYVHRVDPNTKATLPTRNEAHPISLGFVDWGWAAAASFQRISDFDTGGWKFQEDSLVKNTRPESPVFTKTPGGARVEINKVATGDQLDEGLKKNCAKKN